AIFTAVIVLAASAFGTAQAKRAAFDVTNYTIDATVQPIENKLVATTDVTFTPLEDTRNVIFELNGSLKVDSITRIGASTAPAPATGKKPAAAVSSPLTGGGQITFVQDQAGVSDLGPSVRIDLGDTIVKGTPVTLRFKYSGVLNLPQGGPLINKRLAYLGDSEGYLMYAARWFPFHDYAADLATSDITINIPAGLQVVGFSDASPTAGSGKVRFTDSKPGLIGNFAYGKYIQKPLRYGE